MLILFAFLIPAAAGAQDMTEPGRGEFRVDLRSRGDTAAFRLPHRFLRPESDTVFVEGTGPLRRGTDYSLRYAAGILTLRQALLDTLLAGSTASPVLVVRYRYFPFSFSDRYARRTLTILRDSAGTDTLRVARTQPSFGLEEIFGRDLRKSGSLTRGFTVGSNRDLSLSSGFRMQLAGRLASDVEVAASLTDENTPIQPEGTTQVLQEFDNVFVEITGTSYAATLGDFTLDLRGTEFARLTRKLQGARGTADLKGAPVETRLLLSGAVTRGKFQTNQFQGSEGVQGPYRLTGSGGDRSIIVIAGTEVVYVNGERQVRGETNDYVIDYATGEIRFSPGRLITGASRIVVDFEYADRRFTRSLVAAQGGATILDGRGRVSVSYLREADDPDAPIDLELSDTARAVLAAAGGDPDRAVLDGVTRVDSNGVYAAVDSVLADGTPVRFYRFDPGSTGALYRVTFSFVGSGRGDYLRRRPGEFAWNGPGGGDYLPVVLLPFARSHQIIDISAGATPVADLTIGGEFARSEVDVNRFSSADGIMGGHALHFTAEYAPRGVELLGDLTLGLRERFVDSRFAAIDRTNEVEFGRKWGIDTLLSADEETQEATLLSTPAPGVSVGGGYGRITRGEAFRSVRNEGTIRAELPGLPRVVYLVESIRSRDRTSDNRGDWLRQKGNASFDAAWLVPSFRFEAEDRTLRSFGDERTRDGSYRYRVYAPGIAFVGIGALSLQAGYEWRIDDRAAGGTLLRESRSFTHTYSARLAEWNSISSSLDLTLRKQEVEQYFRGAGAGEVRSVLVRNQTRFTPLQRAVDGDVFYQVMTERSSRLERVFARVARGSGNYRYRGDLNGNGLAEDDEFELVRFDGEYIAITLPSDQLFPVIDLKTGIRLRLDPARLSGLTDGGGMATLDWVISESYFRVEEKSTEQELRRIYLLDFSRFQQEGTTLTGSNLFTQDFLFFEGKPTFNARLRFSQRKGLTRFSTGVERSYSRERSVRLRWQLIPEVAGQVDLVNRKDRVNARETSSRVRNITSDGVTLDLAYRPDERVEAGLRLETAHAVDRAPAAALESDFNSQGLRFVYAFPGFGQVRLEASREEVILGTAVDTFPFELTGGRVAGTTWLWRGVLDYRVTQFLQAGVNYDGRVEGGRAAVHTARAEVRAFF